MHRVASLSLAALLTASTLTAQAPAAPVYKPTQWIGGGVTQLSANGNTSTGWNAAYGMAYKKLYVTVATNIFSEVETTANNDYQIGYLFLHKQTPGSKGGAMGVGVTGGLWHPQEGDMSPMAGVSLFGALGKTSRLLGTIMLGQIFPGDGADAVTAVRLGLGFTI
jgi:hypothetical protein